MSSLLRPSLCVVLLSVLSLERSLAAAAADQWVAVCFDENGSTTELYGRITDEDLADALATTHAKAFVKLESVCTIDSDDEKLHPMHEAKIDSALCGYQDTVYCSVQRITRITLVDRDAVGAEAPSSVPEKQPKPPKPRGGTDQDM